MNDSNQNSYSKVPVRALLVDDDKFMLEFVSDLLQDLKIGTVMTANDGAAGLNAYDRSSPKPDLIICDLKMPGTDGFQFMDAIAERKYTGGIVLMSGQETRILNSASLMAQFHQLNILGTIGKPVKSSDLAAVIAKLG